MQTVQQQLGAAPECSSARQAPRCFVDPKQHFRSERRQIDQLMPLPAVRLVATAHLTLHTEQDCTLQAVTLCIRSGILAPVARRLCQFECYPCIGRPRARSMHLTPQECTDFHIV